MYDWDGFEEGDDFVVFDERDSYRFFAYEKEVGGGDSEGCVYYAFAKNTHYEEDSSSMSFAVEELKQTNQNAKTR
jgi:hypothetical protein